MLTEEQAKAKIDDLHEDLRERCPNIERREHYFDGHQPLKYASPEFQRFHGERFAGFSDNWCSVVGKAAPDLTEFAAIHLGDDADDLSADERVLLRDWNINNGPSQSAQGFRSGAVTKRSFALVWGDENDEPILTWEHSSQCIVDYSDESRRESTEALKSWVDDDMEFATLYTVDGVWKYQRRASSLSGLVLPKSFALQGKWEPRPGVEVYTSHPMGVCPMVEFPNRPQLKSGPISDIQGTMAMQDAINLMWAYLFGAGDHATMPARVVMGQEPPKVPILDSNGQKVGDKPVDIEALTRGRMLWLTGQNTKIGQWDAAKLDVFTGVVRTMVQHIASQTDTPITYMSGELTNVNGDTVNALRMPLVMKVKDGWKHLGGPMREVFRRFALVRGDTAVADACRTAVIGWKNPETSSDAQTSDAALKDKQIGWSAAGILENRYGMSQQEIDKELQRREAEGASDPIFGATQALMGGGNPALMNGGQGAPAGGA